MSELSKNAKKDKWVKEHALRINVKISRSQNEGIVTVLEQSGNMQGLIKDALRYYIAHGCPPTEAPTEEEIDFALTRIIAQSLVK